MDLKQVIKDLDIHQLSLKDENNDYEQLKGWLYELNEFRKERENSKYLYIVTVTYVHDNDIEYRKEYIGYDKGVAKETFKNSHDGLWYIDDEYRDIQEKFKIQNPFKYRESSGFCEAVTDESDEITLKQAEEYLDIALDYAIEHHYDYYIAPEDIGITDNELGDSTCKLEIIDMDHMRQWQMG